jgi:iron complex transport system substrate-binding protein
MAAATRRITALSSERALLFRGESEERNMKQNMKRLSVLLLSVALMAMLAACGGGSGQATAVTDLAGTEITLPEKVERIVSLSPSTTEILAELGALDKVVGVDAYSNYPDAANAIEKMGDYNGVNIELVVAAEPDVVLTAGKLQADAMEKLSELNIPVIACEATEYAQIPDSIRLIGKVVEKEDEAEALIEGIKAAEQENARDGEPLKVYYVMSYGDYGNWTSGPGSFINEMIKIAGGHPITEDADPSAPWMDYSIEAMVAGDPDVIIMAQSLGDPSVLSAAAGYKDMRAVKEGRVYTINDDIINRPGPRVKEAIAAISEILDQASEE